MNSFKEYLTEAKRVQSEMPYELDNEFKPVKKTRTVYKLFDMDNDNDPHPLYVGADHKLPVGQWLKATAGQRRLDGKGVKSKLGALAYRPGWHAGESPVATPIGDKLNGVVTYRKHNQRWGEVEIPDDVDWQTEANSRGRIMKNGKREAASSHITDQVPYRGHYQYNTNSNAEGKWIISGHMKINRFLEDHEVEAINKNQGHGLSDLPRNPNPPISRKKKSITEEYIVNANQKGQFIYVYGKSGILSTIATSGQLIGFTQTNVNVKDGGLIYIYDENGAVVNMIPENINEALVPKIFRNVQPSAMFELARMHGTTRFTLNHGKANAGDANHWLHKDLTDDYKDETRVDGALMHKDGKFTYFARGPVKDENGYRWDDKEHPYLKKLEARRAVRGKRGTNFDDNLQVESLIFEGKTYRVDGYKQGLPFHVFENPTKQQLKSLHNSVVRMNGNTGRIRTLKSGGNHYVWDARSAIHDHVAKQLGLESSDDRGWIKQERFPEHDFDITAIHNKYKYRDKTSDDFVTNSSSKDSPDYLDNLLNKFKAKQTGEDRHFEKF